MKKPEEIKKGLWCCSQDDECGICPYANGECHNNKVKADALAYIMQLEASYGQVSKALCGKEKATLDEVLKAIKQLKLRWYT